MRPKCPGIKELSALVSGNAEAGLLAHVDDCPDCRQAIEELREVGHLLRALASAEHAESRQDLAGEIMARLDRPSTIERLPLAFAGTVRCARELTRPAVAMSLAASLVGLALGAWLALSAWNGPSNALATEAYEASSLVEEPVDGLADIYLEDAEADSTSEVGS